MCLTVSLFPLFFTFDVFPFLFSFSGSFCFAIVLIGGRESTKVVAWTMFVVGASYLSLLEAVAARCGLPYASAICEVDGQGEPIYGVEVAVPCSQAGCRCFFFWAPAGSVRGPGFEQAALQAISFLQKIYGFVVVHYNFQGVLLYRRIARAAVSAAARATGMLIKLASQQDLAVQSQFLMREDSLLSLLI